ncbi:hypothetical protein [Paenarthrobacter sp. TA1.8]|uniref:hypothetical protein n=1 Tax=Paenarthrobacter sp. TA1.8 TaxID=3400219 RepID=UPI003B43BC39
MKDGDIATDYSVRVYDGSKTSMQDPKVIANLSVAWYFHSQQSYQLPHDRQMTFVDKTVD